MVHHAPTSVDSSLVDIPSHIMDNYHEVVLGGDIMFVNLVVFYVTISGYIKFGTTEIIKNQQPNTILAAIKRVNEVYY